MQQVEGLTSEDGGMYFVDQTGQYYYQASGEDHPVLTQVQIQEVNEEDEQVEETNPLQEINEIDDGESNSVNFSFIPFPLIIMNKTNNLL